MSPHSLSSPLKIEEAEQWVREGVCDPVIAEQLFYLIQEILSTPQRYTPSELGLSLHYLRGDNVD